jgi:PAS domain S-box-containing protein
MTPTPDLMTMPPSAYEALIEFIYLAPVGIIKFRPDGAIDMANPMAVQLLMPLAGTSGLANLYTLLHDIFPDLPDSVAHFTDSAGQIFDQLQLAIPTTQLVVSFTVNKINPDTLMAVIQDITSAIEQEIRILDDQQRFRAIFENIRDYAIYTVNLDGRVDEWNRSLGRIGGWEPDDVTNAPFSMFFPDENAVHPQSAALLQRARKLGSADLEGWRIRKDGSRFWGDTIATVLADHVGRPVGFVIVTRDLTAADTRKIGLLPSRPAIP